MRRMHPNEYHQKELGKLKDNVPVKKRWDEDEVSKMDMVESRLIITEYTENINQEITSRKIIEAIKGKRRPQFYKKRVEELINGLKLDASNQLPATTGAGSPTKDMARKSEPRGAVEEVMVEEIPDNPLRDLLEEIEEEVDYYMDESTVIYECIEKYIDALNTDTRLRTMVSDIEKSLIDGELCCFKTDPNKSKNLINEYLSILIKPQVNSRSAQNNPEPSPKLSNRKLKKKN